MAMSKRCIPYTPRNRELKDTVFALITTAGVQLCDQEAFNSDKHLGFMGYTQNFRDLYERAAPEMAKIIIRSKADGVVLTAGCPLCHRVVVAIQREVEMVGIPTVLITIAPEQSQQAGPPRAIAPHHFKMGNSLGGPHQNELQRQVLRDALRRWETREEPGNIWEISYPAYDGSTWAPIDLQEG